MKTLQIVACGLLLATCMLPPTVIAQPHAAGRHDPPGRKPGPVANTAPAMPNDGPPPTVSFTADRDPSTYKPLPRQDFLIAHATVLDGAGHRFDDADVLVRDGKIVAVGSGLDGGGARVIDARNRWVTPGIVDPHSHNGTYSMPLTSIDNESSDVSELSSPIAADTWIEHAINSQDASFLYALKGGVTTLQVLPGSTPQIGGRAVTLHTIPAPTVAAMKFPGAPQGLKMACGENAKGYFGGKGQKPTSRQGEMSNLRDIFYQADAYRQRWRHYQRDPKGPPPARDLKLDTLAAVLDGDLLVNIHCYRADDMAEMQALASEFKFKITAFHHAVEGYKAPDLFRKTGTCAVVWPDWWGFKMEANDGIRENAAILDAAGVCVTLHSDSPVIGQHLNIEAAKAAGAGRHMGLAEPPEHVITWITSNPARVLGLQDRIGTLAPGYNADIVIWSGNPFSVYAQADLVTIDGAVAYDRADPAYQPVSDFQLGRKAGGIGQ
ncbi:amidohydrolase family protein [Asticcacaulis sp. 201]|uniref:amidohydrolase family protein n=1 Tax=Asticcacaulis sp. 201 TaxID=3028787 RepID=UPI0029167CB4|nr:amidohydrolase family protein [Asticcacaulis sp. 201]MDV6330736.1 amidohydrolase family protein [Asticcacaulis sp. 201]